MTEYTILRARRKTVAIHITREGNIEVRAPYAAPRAQIDRFVQEKAGWIAQKQAEMRRRIALRPARGFLPGQTLPLFGKEYPVEDTGAAHASFDGVRFQMPRGLAAEGRAAEVERLYRALARSRVQEAVTRYAPLVGVRPRGVRISGAKTRWGSCSAKGWLNFSYRLMLAPEAAVDYVVVHELTHLVEHNHSSRFWTAVERVLPDRKAREALLRACDNEL